MTICCCFLTIFYPRHIKYLESRSELLDAALQQAEESSRRREEARGMVLVLKRENEILRRTPAPYNQANNPAALSSLTLPPHNPPPRQLPSILHQQNGQGADPMLSVNISGPVSAAVNPNSLSNKVRLLQGRARELRELDREVQAGTWKRCQCGARCEYGGRERRRGRTGTGYNGCGDYWAH